jgi:hypothetical protein
MTAALVTFGVLMMAAGLVFAARMILDGHRRSKAIRLYREAIRRQRETGVPY